MPASFQYQRYHFSYTDRRFASTELRFSAALDFDRTESKGFYMKLQYQMQKIEALRGLKVVQPNASQVIATNHQNNEAEARAIRSKVQCHD